MTMDSHDKREPITLFKSFFYALSGIFSAIKSERNIRIHLVCACLVIGASCYFSITKGEWLIILVLIGGMVALELMNTAIERVVDLVTTERHPLAKQAKDIAAGAVMVYAIIAAIIGVSIFLPYFLAMF